MDSPTPAQKRHKVGSLLSYQFDTESFYLRMKRSELAASNLLYPVPRLSVFHCCLRFWTCCNVAFTCKAERVKLYLAGLRYLPCFHSELSLKSWASRQLVGLLGWRISPSQSRFLERTKTLKLNPVAWVTLRINEDFHASSEISIHARPLVVSPKLVDRVKIKSRVSSSHTTSSAL